MTWSTARPTKPGWYWWRNLIKARGPLVVEVWIDEHGHLKSGPPAYFVEGSPDVPGDEWAQRGEIPPVL